MENNIIKTIILSFLVCLFISCGNEKNEKVEDNSIQEEAAGKAYYCPMKCEGEKTYNEPGECPVCHMDLEESEAEHEHGDHEHHH